MPLTRRALIVSAAAAGLMAPLALAAPTRPRTPLPAGIWHSRTTADLLVFDGQARRTYTRYDNALALVDESSLGDIEQETREAIVHDDGHLELEYWGTVTRFQYDHADALPETPRLGKGNWMTDPGMNVAAFFDALSGHFAFANEQGIDWTKLRAECDAALRRGPASQEHLFNTLAGVMRQLKDGHGSLRGMGHYEESRAWKVQLHDAWRAAGGRPADGSFSNGFSNDWYDHVQRRILSGKGHLAARDTVAWGRLPNGLGYVSLLACESLSEDEGGHADVLAARQVFSRALKDLKDARGLIVDLRFNYGGWDRVPLDARVASDGQRLPRLHEAAGKARRRASGTADRGDPGARPPVHRPCGDSDQRCHPQRRGGRNLGVPCPAEYPFIRASDLWRAVRSVLFPPAEWLEGCGVERDLPGIGRQCLRGFGRSPRPTLRRAIGAGFLGIDGGTTQGCRNMAAGALIAMRGPHLMRRALLTTTAVIACLMLAPSVEARPAPRQGPAGTSVKTDHGTGNPLVAVAQSAQAEDDEEDERTRDEGEEDEDDEGDDSEEEDEEDQGTTS